MPSWIRPTCLVSLILVWQALACSPTLAPPDLPRTPAEAYRTEQFHLLLYPEENGESLLGREVFETADGSFTVADARAPGCRVEAAVERARFRTRRRLATKAMTSVAASYAQLVSLQTQFGRSTVADLEIENKAILRGRAAGTCGALIIDRVFVGTGSRRMVALADDTGNLDVQTAVVKATPQVSAAKSIIDELEWQDEQGYGFSFRKYTNEESLEVHVSLSPVLREGEQVQIRFEAPQQSWLVVYALDESGTAAVLWPSIQEPEPSVAPGAPTFLPSARERAQGVSIRAAVREPGKPSREMLVVYAVRDLSQYRTLKPLPGTTRLDGAAFAAELTQKLQTLPVSQWSRSVTEYVVEPR